MNWKSARRCSKQGGRRGAGRAERRRRRRVDFERLENRWVLTGDIEITLDTLFDQFGFQPETTQVYEDKASLGALFDTGASVVTWAAADQFLLDPFEGGNNGIPIKVPGGAQAEGIGGTLTGDVSQPGTVLVDGFHVNVLGTDIFGSDGGLYFDHLQGRGSVAADAAAANSLVGDQRLNLEDDVYNGFDLVFTVTASGSAANQSVRRTVTDYDGQSRTFTFANDFPAPPLAGDQFHLIADRGTVAGSLPQRDRFRAAGTGGSLLPGDGAYVGRYLLFTSGRLAGKSQLIVGYDGSSKTFELALPFSRRPDIGDSFDILVGTGSSAIVPGVQMFVGTFQDSNLLPTISGTPMLNPTTPLPVGGQLPNSVAGPQPLHPDGLAVDVQPQGLLLDLGELLGDLFPGGLFDGLILPIPSVQFRDPGTLLEPIESFHAESPVDTTAVAAQADRFAGSSDLLAEPDFYIGFHVRFLTGDLKDEIRQVTAYDAASRTFSFDSPFSLPPAAGDVFELVRLSSDPITLGLDFVGFDNHLDPGDVMTVSYNPVSNDVRIAHDGSALDDQIFLFDTGAQLSTITEQQAADLGLNLAAPEFTISVQGAAGVVADLPGFTIDELSLPTLEGGRLVFYEVPVFVIDVAEEIQGILGMNLFNTAAEFLYDPFDPNHGRPTLQATFFDQRAEVATEIDTSELDPLTAALLESVADLMPAAFGGAVGLREIALPNFGVGVDLDFVPQQGVVRDIDGVSVVTVPPGTTIDFVADVAFAAEMYDAFRLDFSGSHSELSLSDWSTAAAWTAVTDGSLSSPADWTVAASGDVMLTAELGSFKVTVPETAGDYLLTAADESANTRLSLTGLIEPLPIRDFGDIVIRVQDVPSLTVADAELIEGAGAAAVEFTVTLTGPVNGSVVVEYQTVDGTATVADGDYTARSGRLEFAAGETEKTIVIPVHGDDVPEAHENFFVELFNAAVVVEPLELEPVSDVTGIDVDGLFFESLAADDAVELQTQPGPPKTAFALEFDLDRLPNSASVQNATLVFTETMDAVDPLGGFFQAGVYGYVGDADGVVTLANPFNQPFSFPDYSIGNRVVGVEMIDVTSFIGTLVGNQDRYAGFYVDSPLDPYAIHSSEASDPGNRPKLRIEFDSGSSGVQIADGRGVATIRNDDTVVSITGGGRPEGDFENGEAVFFVELSQPSALDVAVSVATVAGTAAAGIDFQMVDHTVVFAAGETMKTISVPVMGDLEIEPDETFLVGLADSINASIASAAGSAMGTIINDDADEDVDGVNSAVEDRAPNLGDGNGDGIKDSLQANVVSLPNAVDDTYVSISVPAGVVVGDVSAVLERPAEALPLDREMPLGFFDFVISGIPVGGAVTAVVHWESEEPLNGYMKFGPTPDNPMPHWYSFSFDGTTGAKVFADRIELHLVDGGRGDADLQANGVIVDPGAPIVNDHPWQNPVIPYDIDNDALVRPLDVLLLVNELNTHSARLLATSPFEENDFFPFWDVTGDDELSPEDVLAVIQFINGVSPQSQSLRAEQDAIFAMIGAEAEFQDRLVRGRHQAADSTPELRPQRRLVIVDAVGYDLPLRLPPAAVRGVTVQPPATSDGSKGDDRAGGVLEPLDEFLADGLTDF